MGWILGIVGALLGVLFSESRELLGFVGGFVVGWLIGAIVSLRQRLQALETTVASLRGRVAAKAMTEAPVAPSVEPMAAPASPMAEEPVPISPTPVPELAPRPTAVSAPPPVPEADIAPPPVRPTPVPPVARPAVAMASTPREPTWDEKLVGVVKRWFTEGNVPVKIGILVLFFGVAAALRYAATLGYFTFPIEFRLAGIAAAAVFALGFGWRERQRRPAFALSLQGGALGVLLLTVFAAYRYWHLLPPQLTFALIIVLVAGAALLAVLQNTMSLAVLGFLGGYLAPVLISTGSHDHVALFSYYAVLNAAVFAISWRQNWRLLNLIGFIFTFGVGAAWGMKFYQPENFSTVEPFLILFFLFYLAIGLLYVIRQTEYRRPWVDGTLVFGTPLLAFPLQAGLLKDDRPMLALSSLLVAVIYAGLVFFLHRRRNERLLAEAYGALALGFATLAVPLAFSAGTTASVWALEGAGVAWLGIRQNRKLPWLSGLALQLMAAVSYLIWVANQPWEAGQHEQLLLNGHYFGAAVIALAGFLLSAIHDRHKPVPGLAAVLFAWAMLWWFGASVHELDLAEDSIGSWPFAMMYLAFSLLPVAWLRTALPWPRLGWLQAVTTLLALLMVFTAMDEYRSPLARPTWLAWALYAAVAALALWRSRPMVSGSVKLAHLAVLWTAALAVSFQIQYWARADQMLGQGWYYAAYVAPLCVMTLTLWRRPALAAWPLSEEFASYRIGWFSPALFLLVIAWLVGLFLSGGAEPLIYLPLLNPLELSLVAIAFLVGTYLERESSSLRGVTRLWPYLGFSFLTLATLRAVHHWHGEVWSPDVLRSGFSQAALAVVWSLVGVSGMFLGSRRRNRPLWIGGMTLMILVCAKLVFVDRQYVGNLNGIVSFLAVGLLLVGVGYFAPSPPKTETREAA